MSGENMSDAGQAASLGGSLAGSLAATGAGATSTGVGAPVGIPLMIGGALLSKFGGASQQADAAQQQANSSMLQNMQQQEAKGIAEREQLGKNISQYLPQAQAPTTQIHGSALSGL